MDNPATSRSSFFGHRKQHKVGIPRGESALDLTAHAEDTDDDAVSVRSEVSHQSKSSRMVRNKHSISNYFSSHMAMSTLEPQRRKLRSHTDDIRDSYRSAVERWVLLQKLNRTMKPNDPLIYAATRLGAYLHFYDSMIENIRTNPQTFREQQTLSSFWSIQAIKFLTGVDGHFSFDVLANFSNNDLKGPKRLKVLLLSNNVLGDPHNWQLAIDNPNSDIYCYTEEPALYTAYPDYRLTVGPSNYRVVHGDSFLNIPLSKGSFAGCVCFEFFQCIKSNDWVEALSEVYRLLSVHGQANFLLMDFTVLNCKNEIYNSFFLMLQKVLVREGYDPFPCKSIQKRLKEAGFQRVRYSFVTLKKGIPNKMGNLMEFVQTFFETVMFKRLAKAFMEEEELELFKQTRLQYNHDSRNGKLLDEFGDCYYMLLFAQKTQL